MSQVQPSLQILILPNKVCGCTATADDGLCMAAVMWGNMTPYSFLDDLLFTLLREMNVYSFEMNACVLGMPHLLCDATT